MFLLKSETFFCSFQIFSLSKTLAAFNLTTFINVFSVKDKAKDSWCLDKLYKYNYFKKKLQ